MELIGLYLVACGLLIGAGVGKAIRPGDTARAWAGLLPIAAPRLRAGVRIGSIAEVVVGSIALVAPRTASACLVAASYALFAAVVAFARSKGGAIASCGCFGKPDTPATMLHVIANAGLSLSAAALGISAPTGTIVTILASQPLHGLPLVAVSALCGWLTYLAISAMAAVQGARRLTGVSFRSPP
ncbi:MAG TPA: MauE/DoxX family redox-associated membrane protein [Acidimicrobiales bacterium]|nr:MauE/DoxX family redox-associated membrane protein [Acidimicrobiales bacterium]